MSSQKCKYKKEKIWGKCQGDHTPSPILKSLNSGVEMKKRDRFFKFYTFCYMPYIKMMRSVWHLFTNVLDQLYMSICDKFTNIKTILFRVGNWANETLLFHVVATFYLITLSNKNVARVIISHEKYIYVCIFCLFVILTNNNVRF